MPEASGGRRDGQTCDVRVPGEVVWEFGDVQRVGWVVGFEWSGEGGGFDFS